MKKIFTLLVAAICALSTWAEDFEVNGIYYNILIDKTNEVEVTYQGKYYHSYFNEYSGSVTIPSTVTYNGTTYSVTSIGDEAFESCSGLTSVTIGNSVTSIGGGAFESCSGLTSVTIPNSVTSIGEYAFAECSSLTSITIGNSVTSIGSSAFSNCSGLKSITIPNSVTSIGEYAFAECSSLTSITIPNSVTSIGDYAFVACSSLPVENNLRYADTYLVEAVDRTLSTYSIKEGTKWIGENAFRDCSSLTSITIPNSVTSIGYEAFCNCKGLTSINVWAEVPPTLGSRVFTNVSKSIPVYVPCGSVSAYQSGWKAFTNIQEPLAEYSIAVGVNDNKMGTAKVDENTICGAQISATANYGYYFTQWSDGITENPRTLVLTQDTTLTAEFALNQYTITTTSSQPDRGTTQGNAMVNYLEYVTIFAEANYGYYFTQWNDGNTDNPCTVQVTENKTYTAYFAKNTYSITKNCNSEHGYINGVSSAEYLDLVTLTAIPNYGYHFTQWSDGETDNLRTLVLTQDTILTAEFAQTYSGQCGDNLYWSFNDKTLTITGFGAMWNERPWGLFVDEIQNVVLPSRLTHIGDDAFTDCVGLSRIDIPYSVISIGDNSFAGCRKLFDVYCYALNPPEAETTSFANYNVYLHVPCDNLIDYQMDMVFGSFKYIQCVGSEQVEIEPDSVIIQPSTNDVTITWPTDPNAETYVIVIKQGDKVFCSLTFNADGMLLNIAFAPSRSGSHPVTYAASTGNGLRFTVTSLEESTTYGYDITTKDDEEIILSTYTGEFTTKSNVSTSVSDIQSPMTDCQKIIRNGQFFILRDGKTYNAMGVEM